MNTVRHPAYFLLFLLTIGLVVSPGQLGWAQEDPVPAAGSALAVASAQPESAKPSAELSETAAAQEDQAAEAPATADAKEAPMGNQAEPASEIAPAKDKKTEKFKDAAKPHRGRRSGNNEKVSFGTDSILATGERAEAVVSIGGSSTSAGEVSDAVVSILGSSRVTGGSVGDSVVSILGNTYINGHVKGEVVTVLGNVEFGPNAMVDGEVVCVGGQVTRDAAAVIKGDIQNIGIAGHHFNFDGLTAWLTQCLLYARPLAFGPHLLWAWCVALAILAIYALVALIAPTAVVKCAETLEQRPGFSLLSALLALLLTPVAYILLALTLFIAIGFVLIPLFSTGLFFATLFGKVVMLAWLGRRITKLLGEGPLSHPVFGVLIGGAIILGLYTIPIAGFVVYKLMGILGLGVVVFTVILQFKASRPAKPAAVAVAAGMSGGPAVVADGGGVIPPTLRLAISAATLPRAGFWIRIAAALLDAVVVGVVAGLTHTGSWFLLLYVAYCVVLWALKGTTIGGIVCGLKVVRLDDRKVDWTVAVVRGLSGFLSLAVAGLGFVWVAFDNEKQSWHDKIAGTIIVRVPKGVSLI